MVGEDSLNVRNFGAVGDGSADDTAALQKALDAAADGRGTVHVPPGTYRTGSLRMGPHTGISGEPTWSYRQMGGSVLRLADPSAAGLIDATGAVGATIAGMCLEGPGPEAGGACGVLIDKPDFGTEEDAVRIERCRISRFGGDGVRLGRIWCFSVRHCMISHNGHSGLWVHGWDGFVLDNWLSGNRGAGYLASEHSASVTMTANRVEWNRQGGIVLRDGHNYNINGNYIDRSGGCGIWLSGGSHFTVASNIIYRSGKPDWRPLGDHESAHVWMDGISGAAVLGNSMEAGRDDGGKGEWSPRFGIVYRRLGNCAIKNNVMHNGALEKLVVDLHDHNTGVSLADNVGCLFRPREGQ